MIDISFLKQLDRLSLVINKRITSQYTGERATKYTGQGLIFKDYTIYAPGEDFRAIDWKVFGRTDKLFIKRFEEERNLTIHIIIDFSASMDFKTSKFKKSEYAAMLAIGFAYMALKNNERFVVSTFAEGLDMFRPRRGKRQLMILLDHLNKRTAQGITNFEKSISQYKALINTKSMIVVISDFLYDVEQVKNTLAKFKNHKVKLIQVLDPMEVDLNVEGDFRLRDLETKEQLRTYISGFMRKEYGKKLSQHQININNAVDQIGAEFYSFSTEKPIFDAFYEVSQHQHMHLG
ncbi:DUF58 domain-containing protein [Candidatus Woesearchaeota archaeon]|nr:DUF58 domain-containing protein [Candidatus Woesearchaeota archaeon]